MRLCLLLLLLLPLLLLLVVVWVQGCKLGVQVGREPVGGPQSIHQLRRGRAAQRIVGNLKQGRRRRGLEKGQACNSNLHAAAMLCLPVLLRCSSSCLPGFLPAPPAPAATPAIGPSRPTSLLRQPQTPHLLPQEALALQQAVEVAVAGDALGPVVGQEDV